MKLLACLLGLISAVTAAPLTLCPFTSTDGLASCEAVWRQNAELVCDGGLEPREKPPFYTLAWGGLRSAEVLGDTGFSREFMHGRFHLEWTQSSFWWRVLAVGGWGVFWGLAGIALLFITIFGISIILFCCCCRRGKSIKSRPKIVGLTVIGVCLIVAIGALIGLEVAFPILRRTYNETKCRSLLEPYTMLYESTPTPSGYRFDGFTSLLDYSDALIGRAYTYQGLMVSSEGRVGNLVLPLIDALYAPILWSDAYLSRLEYSGWIDHNGSHPKWTTGLRLRHAEGIRQAMANTQLDVANPTNVPYNLLVEALMDDRTATFDHNEAANALGDAVNEIQTGRNGLVQALPHASEVMSHVVRTVNVLNGHEGAKGVFNWWIYLWLPIVTWVFLAISGWFLFRYIIRSSDDRRPSHGLRFYVFCGFIGASIWMFLAGATFFMSSFSGDMCHVLKTDFLENGQYMDYIDSEVLTRDVINACLQEGGDGNLVRALGLDEMDFDVIDGDTFEGIDQIFQELDWASMNTTLVREYLASHTEDLHYVESINYNDNGADALSEAAILRLIEDINTPFQGIEVGQALHICAADLPNVCNPVPAVQRYDVSMSNTYHALNEANLDNFFRETPPAVTAQIGQLSVPARTEWINKVRELVIRAAVMGPGLLRADQEPPAGENWASYVYDICHPTDHCSPFHGLTFTQEGPIDNIELLNHSDWQQRVTTDMSRSAEITNLGDVSLSMVNGFLSASPLLIVEDSIDRLRDQWRCDAAFDFLDTSFRLACTGVAGHVAIGGWMSMTLGVAFLVGFALTLDHWIRRQRSYLKERERQAKEDGEADDAERGEVSRENEQVSQEAGDNIEQQSAKVEPEMEAPVDQSEIQGAEEDIAALAGISGAEMAPAVPLLPLIPELKSPPPNSEQELLLLAAAQMGRRDKLEEFQLPPNTVADDHFSNSPLHLAAYGGFTDCVDHLCKAGWDPNARNDLGLTPAEVAASNQNLSVEAKRRVVNLLAESGGGETPISIQGEGSPIGNVSYRLPAAD